MRLCMPRFLNPGKTSFQLWAFRFLGSGIPHFSKKRLEKSHPKKGKVAKLSMGSMSCLVPKWIVLVGRNGHFDTFLQLGYFWCLLKSKKNVIHRGLQSWKYDNARIEWKTQFLPDWVASPEEDYRLDLPPTQDSSGKWRCRLRCPTKNVIILVVTDTGWG